MTEQQTHEQEIADHEDRMRDMHEEWMGDRPAPIHPWRWRALTAWIVIFTAVVIYGLHTIRNDAHRNDVRFAAADYRSCVESHNLITQILLRSVGVSYKQYKAHPLNARAKYRRFLLGNEIYREHPALVQRAVTQTFDILKLSDPVNCPLP
jgi:hypothetical protein